MKIKKVLLFTLFLSTVVSCTVDSEVETENIDVENKEAIVTTIGSDFDADTKLRFEKEQELIEEMNRLSEELYRAALEDRGENDIENTNDVSKSFSAPPPYLSSNSGSVFLNVNGQSNSSK